MKKLIWKIESIAIVDLIPSDYNPRKLSEIAKADLMQSVMKFGQVEPLVVNVGGNVIGGHSRVEVYADLGIEETPVMIPSRKLTKSEEQELNIRLNKNVGEWDWHKLKEFFGADDLMAYGFGEDELKRWFGQIEADGVEMDENRMHILSVFPPEATYLKERASIRYVTKKDYDKVKLWLDKNGAEAAELLLKMAS